MTVPPPGMMMPPCMAGFAPPPPPCICTTTAAKMMNAGPPGILASIGSDGGSSAMSLGKSIVEDPKGAMEEKARKFNPTRSDILSKQKKGGAVDALKEDMPPEHVRKIVRGHGDMSSKKLRHNKRVYWGALKYGPSCSQQLAGEHADRNVKVRYHITGAVSSVNEIPWAIEPVFIAQWGTV